MEQLKIVIVGHVDHGKSTFVGRLFHDTGSLPDGKLEQLQHIATTRGVPFEWANLMDALQSERDQNITIDTAQIWFYTKKRQYVIIDAPGHKEFLKNMVTGAAHAEAALLLIDANEGVQEQSRRHGYLLHMLGIRQLAVLVNKMDLKDYSQQRFQEIESEYRAFLTSLGVEVRLFIPISARHGDNLAELSTKMPWWQGPTVVEALDHFQVQSPPENQPLRFSVQDVYRFDARRILAGRIEAGRLMVGDRLLFSPGDKISAVKSIERWNAPLRNHAEAGESIGVVLEEQLFVERGAIGCHEGSSPFELNRLRARIFWMGQQPLAMDKPYKIKLATQEAECEIEEIHTIIDASTLASVASQGSKREVKRHEVAELTLRTKRPLAFDTHDTIVATGRFVLVDGFEVAGGGVIIDDSYPRRQPLHKSQNIYWSDSQVSHEQRSRRNRHSGCVVWLTGLSGSGKSTIAIDLERELFRSGDHVYVLDGDNVRHGLCSDLAFSAEDRKENIRRIGEVAKLFADAGVICITAFISPYRVDRDRVREIMADSPGRFIEVFVNAPLDVCEERDPKGLYARARANKIQEFTGISAPYEAPLQAEIELPTDTLSVNESVARVVDYLRGHDKVRTT